MHNKLLIASHNKGKVKEFKRMLNLDGIELLSLEDQGITFETSDDFLNNNRRQIEFERSSAIIDDMELKRLGFQVVPNSAHIGGKTKKRRKSKNKSKRKSINKPRKIKN